MTYKVLVVDDQQIYFSLIEKVLSNTLPSIHIFTAMNGLEACAFCELEAPSLILMDWEMPKMSGIDAIKQLKSNPKTALIPIIMVSSRSKQEFSQEALAAGASDFVQKPFHKDHLLSVVGKTLNIQMVA